MANSPLDRSFAQERDAADPLAGFYDRFVRDDPSLIYLDGNSLGMLPLATAERIADVVRNEWGAGLVRSWDRWMDLPGRAGDLLGGQVADVAPIQQDPAPLLRVVAHDALERCRLTHAVPADEGDNPAVPHLDGDAVEDLALPVPRLEAVHHEHLRRAPEVGFDHVPAGPELRVRPLGEDPAARQDRDAL